jgi:hypothetical protein
LAAANAALVLAHIALAVSNHGHDANNHLVGFRHIGSDELDACLLASRAANAHREGESHVTST